MLLPKLIREKTKKSVTIAFFLHTNWPSPEIFRIIPQAKQICDSLLYADLVGFHLLKYKSNFTHTCEDLLNTKVHDVIYYKGHMVKIRNLVLGIQPNKIFDTIDSEKTKIDMAKIAEKYKGKKLIIGVDRIDYIKGLDLKFKAYDLFLENNKEAVIFEQIAIPSREDISTYKNYEIRISTACNSINDKHGRVVEYRHESVDFNYLVALYRSADVCIISSLVDGLNLVAFEYIAAQRDRSGVLLLSKFAGCSSVFNTPMQFNPMDCSELARLIKKALEMPEIERKRIQQNLFKVIKAVMSVAVAVDDNPLVDVNSSPEKVAKRLQVIFLIGNLFVAAANHLPGAYRYAIYQSHGINRSTIELFYVGYYASTLLIGTFIASLADKFGRRLACIFFAVFYILYCLSFHFNLLWVLAIATVPWGIASALDQTVLESWLITEHRALSLDSQSLKRILGNTSVVKILTSIGMAFISQPLVQYFGYTAPFDVAIGILFIMVIFILLTWKENYGNKDTSSRTSFVAATKILRTDFRVVLLGLSSSFFETAVYIHGIQWTPILQSAKSLIIHDPIPLGYCFAGQVLFRFIGTSAFAKIAKHFRAESFMIVVFLLSAAGLSVPLFAPDAQWPILIGFFLYEFCVGVYRPSMSYLKSQYIPDEVRATLMNYMRIPQLLLVLAILLSHFSLFVVYILWMCMLLLAMIFMIVLRSLKVSDKEPSPPVTQVANDDSSAFLPETKQSKTSPPVTNVQETTL
ncbi:unnamed protein product [Adineta steineri]|nr:unnamed protein product [Adineta steineri]